MAKLWSKGVEPDALVEAFTVGDDYLLDTELLTSDVLGSIAHATMLREVGLLNPDEMTTLVDGLRELLRLHEEGSFHIRRDDEDGHTAIENFLVERCGDAGKKIHTGRSRNDQVLVTLRIWMRWFLLSLIRSGGALVQTLLVLAEKHRELPMPGRTHMQPAMPSSVGLWAASWAEELLDDLRMVQATAQLVDQNPLGAAAGYGTSLPLDRERTAELLGFSRVQVNVGYVHNSRGKFESRVLEATDQIGLTLSKAAQDLILFSLPEFGWFRLPDELCTGSSIMPQKRNPDILELVRAKSAVLSAETSKVKGIIRSLPSGYNRDFQETKGPLLRSAHLVRIMIDVMDMAFSRLEIDQEKLRGAFDPSIFATDAAYDLVRDGMPFRDAYRDVASRASTLENQDPERALESRTSTGTPGNLCLDVAEKGLTQLIEETETEENRLLKTWERLAGRPVRPA